MSRPHVTVREGLGIYQRLIEGNITVLKEFIPRVNGLLHYTNACVYLIGVDSSSESLQQGLNIVDTLLEKEVVSSERVVIDSALLYRDDANLIRRMCWKKGILAKQFEDNYVADQLKSFAQAREYTKACLELDVAAYEGMKAFTAREEEIFLPKIKKDFEDGLKAVYLLDHWHLGSNLMNRLEQKQICYAAKIC